MLIDRSFARQLAHELLRINAVVLRPNEPFVWSSGWNSPIYCDNRLTLLYPDIRERIADILTGFIKATYPDVEVITGTATAGIPHAAWVSDRLKLPMAYVRSKAKSYGMGNQIEGGVRKGQKTIVIEDLISTGGSILSVIDALQFVGADVKGCATIFTYQFDVATSKFQDLGLRLDWLTDYPTLIEVALEEGRIKEEDLQLLNRWREEPSTWPR
jgi:orotate phosphoribosyltransferase